MRLAGRAPAAPGLRGLFDAASAMIEEELADRPLSGDLEATRQLLFDDALWMEAERD